MGHAMNSIFIFRQKAVPTSDILKTHMIDGSASLVNIYIQVKEIVFQSK